MRELLGQYISDTLSYVHTVEEFCDRHPRWILQRKEEQSKMTNIKEIADRIDLKFVRVLNAEDKTKALGEFTKDYLTQMTANRRRKELEKELEAVLKDTLKGLEELDCFMDAVERLVVTSLFVFADENRLCPLPQGREPASVRAVITSARMACPLLIHFKRDASAFFSPCLLNVEVLHVYLENYIHISEQLCERMGLGKTNLFSREKNDNLMIDTSTEVTEQTMQTMFNHLHHLSDIRMDQHLRLTFLFQESALNFIGLFSQRHSRMLAFLKELEKRAGKLDKMKKGGYISSVVGGAVGATGGALTIAGLCLAPVTAGLSLGLTIAGIGTGVTSGVNSLTTGVTKVAFKSYQNKKANTIFQCFMEDMQRLHGSLEKVASNICPLEPKVMALVVGKNIGKGGASLGKKINAIVKNTSAIEALMGKGVVMGAGKVGLQEGKTFAADLSDIGMLAQGTPLALSKTLRQCAVASNALFIGLDIITICKDSVSLAKGSKSTRSKLIRARVALWRTEIDSCQRIHDSLCRGIWRFRKSQRILEKPFHLVKELESLQSLVEMGLMEQPRKEMGTLGQPEDDTETLVQPMEVMRLLGQPIEEMSLLEQPMEEMRLLEQPMEEMRLLGQPMEEMRLLGQPMEEMRHLGQPMEEMRLLEQPMEEMRLLEQPMEEMRLLGKPMEEMRLLGQPMEEMRLLEQPMEEIRLLEQTMEEMRLLEQPMEEMRLLGQPMEEMRLREQPMEEMRLLGQTIKETEKGFCDWMWHSGMVLLLLLLAYVWAENIYK